MSICKFKLFSGGYTPDPVNRGREKGREEKGKGGKGEGTGRRREGEGKEIKALGRRGGEGMG
jgi:hypothetical protein